MTYPLPTVVAGQSGKLARTNALHNFYNMMMAHLDGARATSFVVNVQHPDFGADGHFDTLNQEQGINAAMEFVLGSGTQHSGAWVWLPGMGANFARAQYKVGSPVKVFSNTKMLGNKSQLRADPSTFDFVTRFETGPGTWGDMEQAVLEGWNLDGGGNGRLGQGDYEVTGIDVDCRAINNSIGWIFNTNQPTHLSELRVTDYRRVGGFLTGQDALLDNIMMIGETPEPGDSATHPMIGLHIGMPSYVGAVIPGSLFTIRKYNAERFHRAVHVEETTQYGLKFIDVHLEPTATYTNNVADPAYGFYVNDGDITVDWLKVSPITTPTAGYMTILKVDPTLGGNVSARLMHVYLNAASPGTHDHTVFVDDSIRGHLIYAWGDTKLSGVAAKGIVRRLPDFILPSGQDGTFPGAALWIANDESGYVRINPYNRETADADQLPLIEVRPGDTQVGDLIMFKDTGGVERYRVSADGLPELPAYTNAGAFPSATGKQARMVYNLATNRIHYSDGSAWKELSVV